MLTNEVDWAFNDLLNKFVVAFSFERRVATNQNVQDYSHWPHVCSSAVIVFICEYLRCTDVCLLEWPKLLFYLLQTFYLQKHAPDLDTSQRILDHVLLLEKRVLHVQILKLQVPMHKFPLLAVPDRDKNLLHNDWKFVFRNRVLVVLQYQLNHLLVILFNSLHHSVHPLFALVHLMYFLNAVLVNWL